MQGCVSQCISDFTQDIQDISQEYTNMAFVFLNQYLDIIDAMEEGDTGVVDNSIFEGTGRNSSNAQTSS